MSNQLDRIGETARPVFTDRVIVNVAWAKASRATSSWREGDAWIRRARQAAVLAPWKITMAAGRG